MSDAQDQGEPTMEEILASIRKIISEDGTPEDGTPEGGEEAGQAAEAPAEAEAAAEAAAADSPGEAEEAPAAEAPAEAAADAGGDDEDVLDLTRMVGEDGDVVDIAEAGAEAGAAAGAEPEAADEDVSGELPDLIAVDEPAEPEVAAQAADDSILANTTQAAVTSTLANLAATVGPQDAGLRSDSKTLEVLVREVMEPYLKTWLDENLAGMVERIVRDEVQKMVRRAEFR